MKKIKLFFVDCSQDKRQEHPQHFFSPLEIGYCSSLLKSSDCEVSFVDTRIDPYSSDDISKKIIKENPDIILFKPSVGSREFVLKLSECLQGQQRKLIFCYGPTATIWPDMFLFRNSPVSGCLIEEIEETVPDLVKLIGEGKSYNGLRGVAEFDATNNCVVINKRELMTDLDSLPLPSHELFLNKNYFFGYPLKIFKKARVAYVLSSRGCPEKCNFCSILRRNSYGKHFRARSEASVALELEKIIQLGFNSVYFMDDNFCYDKERVRKICAEIISRGINKRIKWVVQCSVKSLNDEVIELMRKAGCSTVCLGIESASKKILNNLEKDMEIQRALEIINSLKRKGILIVAYFIIGNPKETSLEVLESLEFCKDICPDMLQLHYFSAYPDSRFIRAGDSAKLTTPYEFDPQSNFSNMSGETLSRLYVHFYRSYYFNLATITNFFRKQLVTYIINWEQKVFFCMKGLKYMLGRSHKKEIC